MTVTVKVVTVSAVPRATAYRMHEGWATGVAICHLQLRIVPGHANAGDHSRAQASTSCTKRAAYSSKHTV
jgi:hypothetical protein